MLLLRWFAPVTEPVSVTPEEQQRYMGWLMPVVLAYLLFSVLCSTLVFACLRLLFALLVRRRFASLVILEPVPHLWGLIALFLGLVSASWITSWWLRHAIGTESERFERFHDQRFGYDSRRAMPVLASMIGVGAVVLFAAGITTADQLTMEGIVVGKAFVVNPPLRRYNTVRTITYGTRTKTMRRGPQEFGWFVVTFDDGARWSTWNVWWDGEDRMLVRTVLELVSARSGRQIEER